MTKKSNKLVFHLITSKIFWVGAPMLIPEIIKRGHYISVFDEKVLPQYNKILDCDICIDMSAIISKRFYNSLGTAYNKRKLYGLKTPLMVDPPRAIINSLDKRRTHKIFSDLVPESYNLTGRNNEQLINNFRHDEFVIVKSPTGWWGKDIDKITPQQALEKYSKSKDLIIQKYVPFTEGVGRIVTFNYEHDFKIACSYLRIPNSWRTGTDVDYKCVLQPVNAELYNFALAVSKRCGLYFNGIDYIRENGRYVLLEVNAVPAMKEPYIEFKIDIPSLLLDHIERSVIKKQDTK